VKRGAHSTYKLTPQQRDQIVALWIAGKTGPEIAPRFGVHREYPGQIARRRGAPYRENGRWAKETTAKQREDKDR